MDDIIYQITNGHDVRGDDSFITSRSGHKTWHYTTKGWFLCVRRKDG